MKKTLVSLNSAQFGSLAPSQLRTVLGGEQTSQSTNGSYTDTVTGKQTKCPDRELVTWHKDKKTGEIIEDSRGCTEYFINGEWR